ncbi:MULTISPECIES: hypothetical protein [Halobacterium]|uniref:DUF7285 family protein n=1 Tax=Halobacterium TaxID=2239 RepID=UPI00073F9F2F|nr:MULTISPECIES: hypothetical protein [Halobacterium]MCG1002195.1 hypothetical protein [Halobacterium noricense]
MSRSSAREAQVEPLPALVAVAVVCLAVGAFATVRADVFPAAVSDAPTDEVLADAVAAASPTDAVVVAPDRLTASVAPAGYEVNVTVTAGDREWAAGEQPPPDAATASQRVPVRVAAGRTRPGRLTVEVWS